MLLGIDASRAFEQKRTGTGEYSYQIIKHLAKMNIDCQVVLYVKKKDLANIDFVLPDNPVCSYGTSFKVKIISFPRFWTQIGLASEMLINKPDVLFIPSYTVPQIHPSKTVATVHGLEYRCCPECYSLKERFILELNTQFSVKWASKIIVPSENTKKDLIKFYKTKPDKIKVIAHGIGIPLLGGARGWVRRTLKSTPNFSSRKDGAQQEGNNNFNILFIGRLEKRKNLMNLIKAFNLFKKTYNLQPTTYNLILAGKKGFGFDEIKKAIEVSPYKKDIVLKDYISEEEKSELYKNADLFILPSFYEGFGLPVLEAMSYGVPVICSAVSSLPEVVGNAALLVDPNDPKAIAEAMNKVFSDNDLRERMIEKGFKNVKRFSWEKCAKETMDIILSSLK